MLKISVVLALAGTVLLALSFMPIVPQANDRATSTPAAHGKALFQAKGCASCHIHQAVANSRDFGYNAGPDLSTYQADPAYLQRWLRNPQAIKPNTRMPNLYLNDDEITALIAFLGENATTR
jgi:cytochrome c oxidase subunit 2